MIPRAVLSPISFGWSLSNFIARKILSTRALKLPCPVISVGNIVAGGVGKTEVTIAIANYLQAKGKKVVIASRGYRSKWESSMAMTTQLETAMSLEFPDESLVTLRKAPGVTVVVGANRTQALLRYWNEMACDVVLLDDGFQHFKLARDLDILVHDFSVPFQFWRDFQNTSWRLPAVRIALSDVPSRVLKRTPEWIRSKYKFIGSLPTEAIAFCGIGNPKRFRKRLEEAGVKIVGFKTLRDHAYYNIETLTRVASWQKNFPGLPCLTTLKDYVKLEPYQQAGFAGIEKLSWVDIQLEFIDDPKPLWSSIDRAVEKKA